VKNNLLKIVEEKEMSPSDDTLIKLGLTRTKYTRFLKNSAQPTTSEALSLSKWLKVTLEDIVSPVTILTKPEYIIETRKKGKRINISSGAPWEDIVGYCRAVRIGNVIEVAGTTATVDGQVVGKGDPYLQSKVAFEKIEAALKEAGASMADVVRTRMFVTDISQWEAYGKAHGEFFKTIKPAATMVEVKALIDPDMMVEIEVSAIIGG